MTTVISADLTHSMQTSHKESPDISLKVENATKIYRLYDKHVDRLKESINPFRKKYHRDVYALHNVSFEVRKGETVGIIGRNGSGKSTLLKIITGVLTPTSGSVMLCGTPAALLELGTGFNPELTGIENIYFSGTIMGFTKEDIDNKLDAILAFADIGDYANQPVFDARHEIAFRLFNGFTEGCAALAVDLYATTVVFHNYADPPQQGLPLVQAAQEILRAHLPWLRAGVQNSEQLPRR